MKRYVKSSTAFTDDDIKRMISAMVLKSISDYGLQTALRRILFNKNNTIDWQSAWNDITEQMPEYSRPSVRYEEDE